MDRLQGNSEEQVDTPTFGQHSPEGQPMEVEDIGMRYTMNQMGASQRKRMQACTLTVTFISALR